ncbi:putative thioredoxin [Mrakia frigida]|uniref:thioredoxin family protein n=1 Tax=Mrakia frigida TaxID=29902 RepID=UPI003FCC0F66
MFSRVLKSSLTSRAFSSTPRKCAIFASATEEVFSSEVLSKTDGRLVLVDFYAEWCRPCKMLAPTLHKVAEKEELDIDLVTVDTEDLQEIAAKYKISSLPTVFAFRNGEPVDKFVGMRNEQAVIDFVKKAQGSA